MARGPLDEIAATVPDRQYLKQYSATEHSQRSLIPASGSVNHPRANWRRVADFRRLSLDGSASIFAFCCILNDVGKTQKPVVLSTTQVYDQHN
jgi:hypothetical protein